MHGYIVYVIILIICKTHDRNDNLKGGANISTEDKEERERGAGDGEKWNKFTASYINLFSFNMNRRWNKIFYNLSLLHFIQKKPLVIDAL